VKRIRQVTKVFTNELSTRLWTKWPVQRMRQMACDQGVHLPADDQEASAKWLGCQSSCQGVNQVASGQGVDQEESAKSSLQANRQGSWQIAYIRPLKYLSDHKKCVNLAIF
jgi:hypothetical protein